MIPKRTRLLTLTALLLATAPALAHDDGKVDPLPPESDVIAFRHYLMENVGANAKAMKRSFEAGELPAMVLHAQAIALHATRVEGLFPKGSTSETSRAMPEIWQRWDEFVSGAHTMRDRADALARTIPGGDKAKVGAAMKSLFVDGCKSCHDAFRVPDEDE